PSAGMAGAHVTLAPGHTSSFGPGTEGGRYSSLFADAEVGGDYEFDGATVEPQGAASVSDVFVSSTGRNVHFQVSPDPNAREAACQVRVTFRNRHGGAAAVATSPVRTYPRGQISIGPQIVPAPPPYMVGAPAPAPRLLPL